MESDEREDGPAGEDRSTGAGEDRPVGGGEDRRANAEADTGPRRLCARVACGESAVATLTADYESRVMAVGPLSPQPVPQTHDLCERHAARLSPPAEWRMIRHDSLA